MRIQNQNQIFTVEPTIVGGLAAPSPLDWNLEIQDEEFFITVFSANAPGPPINGGATRWRILPETNWTMDSVDFDQGDAQSTIQVGETVEAQVAWGFNGVEQSPWSASKFATRI